MPAWRLPAGLPAGRMVTPDPRFALGEPVPEPVLWVSEGPVVDAGAQWARLRGAHPRTGLWPLLLTPLAGGVGAGELRPWHNGELAPVPAEVVDRQDAGRLLASWWNAAVDAEDDDLDFGEDLIVPLPFRRWPGLAEPGASGVDPGGYADAVLTSPGGVAAVTSSGDDPYLGLVPAVDGASALTACGWMSGAGSVDTAVVIRSWQERFGGRLCALGFDTLGMSVAWPPRTAAHAQRVAAEHYAFCPDLIDQAVAADSFDEYVTGLVGAGTWWFWWD